MNELLVFETEHFTASQAEAYRLPGYLIVESRSDVTRLDEFSPEATRELAKRYVDRGFTAVKFGWEPMGESEAVDIDLVRGAREGVGEVTVACKSEMKCKSRKIGLPVAQLLERFAEAESIDVLVDRQADVPPKHTRQVIRGTVHASCDFIE